jgi:HD superfamily phosphohydrolase YqeK
VLFIADKVEPDKLTRRSQLQAVYDAAQTDLDTAVLRYLDLYLEDAVRHGWQLHRRVVAARNQLLSD